MFSRHKCKLKCYCRNQFKCENDKICCLPEDVISEYHESSSSGGEYDSSYPKKPSHPTYPHESSHTKEPISKPNKEEDCKCVPFYKCHNRSLEHYGSGSLLYK